MSVKKRIIQILNLWRLLPAYLCVFSTPVAVKEIILEDIWHWGKCAKRVEKKQFDLFSGLMLELKEFRNLLLNRLYRGGLRRYILRTLFPPMDTLYINTRNIGHRLYI